MISTQILVAFGVGLLLLYVLAKFFVLPLKILTKLLINGIIGGVILVVLNYFGDYVGLNIPINLFSALTAGFLGLPGIVLLIALQMLM